MKTKPLLDIIIAHHGELLTSGRSDALDMLKKQVCVEKDLFTVTVVTGMRYDKQAEYIAQLEYGETFNLEFVRSPGSTLADYYNTGIEKTNSDWIMFCHFDDMLADVCSMRMLLDNLPTDDCDVIWTKVARETRWNTGDMYINCCKEADFTVTCGKMYRRAFLQERDIRFCTFVPIHTETIFNAIVLAEADPFRIKQLTSEIYPYFKRFTKNGMKHTLNGRREFLDDMVARDVEIAAELVRRDKIYESNRTIASALCHLYYGIYLPDKEEKNVSQDDVAFFREFRNILDKLSESDMEVVKAHAEVEMINYIQNAFNEQRAEYYFKNDDISFEEWLVKMDRLCDQHGPNHIIVQDEPDKKDPRVVIYCGTSNVYQNMCDSLKSLLCTTPVDKVYFLIEDEQFPYELPDIVTCINVSDQKYFPEDGPNYDNAWTWMCMIRAAYPEMFPQYDKVLSLDIDVVVKDNVSDLWDYDLTDYYLAGVPEPCRQKKAGDPIYINFGVTMMNLAKLREDNKQNEIIDMLNRKKVDCPEQTAFNEACAGKILAIPNDFNVTAYSHITGVPNRERITHYAGQKFWRYYSSVKQYANLDWTEVMERQVALHA